MDQKLLESIYVAQVQIVANQLKAEFYAKKGNVLTSNDFIHDAVRLVQSNRQRILSALSQTDSC